MQQEADLSQKQKFLYQEVIEAGLNPDQFQQFLLNGPKASIDLQEYTLDELKQITKKFKQTHSNKDIEEQTIQQEQKDTDDYPKLDQEISPTKTGFTTLSYNIKHETFQKKIQCVKSNLPYYSDKVKITIDKYEKKQGGVFQKSYFIFQIKVQELGLTSERRYSDFEWMRETLMLLHPGLPIPPISKKGKTDDKHLAKRMYLLQKCLNKMFSIADIRGDQVFEKFLSIPTQKQFEKFKLKFKKLKTVPIQKMHTVTGSFQLLLNQELNTFISRSQKYISITQPELKKIYKGFKGAAEMLENCSAFLKGIGNNCHKLSVNQRQFRKQCSLFQTEQNIFSLLDEMTSRYAELLTQQAKTFRKQIYALVKYESLYMLNLIQSFKKLGSLQQTFIEDKQNLAKKKQKLYQEGNISKWGLIDKKITIKPEKQQAFDLMLPKQTKQVMNQRQKYALYNSQIHLETKRYFTNNQKFLYDYFEKIVKMETDIGSRNIMVWADVLTKTKGITIQVQ